MKFSAPSKLSFKDSTFPDMKGFPYVPILKNFVQHIVLNDNKIAKTVSRTNEYEKKHC